MNVTFLRAHQSKETGNELYRAGAKATLEDGAVLVALGVAREGWGVVPAPPAVTPVTDEKPQKRTRRKTTKAAN